MLPSVQAVAGYPVHDGIIVMSGMRVLANVQSVAGKYTKSTANPQRCKTLRIKYAPGVAARQTDALARPCT